MTARSTVVSNEAVRLAEIEEQFRAFQAEFRGSRKKEATTEKFREGRRLY